MKLLTKSGLALLICTLLLPAADVANLTGVWNLNVKKSKFQKDAAPISVQLKMEHSEPALKYSGTVLRNQESAPDTFSFQGAIDGKIYPVAENGKTGRTIKFSRKSSNSIESWSSDSAMEEHAVTTLPANGRTLTRQMHVKQKDGKVREWIEVYDKQD